MKFSNGQVAVVTGAGSGIGRALAEAFGRRGLAIVLADIEPSPLEAAVSDLALEGMRVSGLRCDVRNASEVDGLRDHALTTFGRIDIVCNNAGVIIPFAPLWETTTRDWDWIQSVNLRGVFNGIRSFAPLLVAQGHGHVVNTASLAGVMAGANNGPYTATKHAVVSLTETLAADFAKAGVNVGATVLCCGITRTRIHESGCSNRPSGALPGAEKDLFDIALDPIEVADLTLHAVEAGRLYAFTDAASATVVKSRMEHLLRDLAPL